MQYIKDCVIYTEFSLRASLPNVSLPETLTEENVLEFGFLRYLSREPSLTQEELMKKLQRDITTLTQERLDKFARTRGYDGILSLCTYSASSIPKFSTEGRYGVDKRDETWAKLYDILDEVTAGTRSVPSGFSDIEPELPTLEWPA